MLNPQKISVIPLGDFEYFDNLTVAASHFVVTFQQSCSYVRCGHLIRSLTFHLREIIVIIRGIFSHAVLCTY